MIQGHSDIEEPIFVDFLRQLYDDLVRLKESVPCRAVPRRTRISTNQSSDPATKLSPPRQ
jgi:hypothetical protein